MCDLNQPVESVGGVTPDRPSGERVSLSHQLRHGRCRQARPASAQRGTQHVGCVGEVEQQISIPSALATPK
jgi:hypothetical protein